MGLRRWAFLVTLVASSVSCAAHHVPKLVFPAEQGPDLSAMVELVGRYGVAHGCPVGPLAVLTAAHVSDPEERCGTTLILLLPPYVLRMSDSTGHEDTASPVETIPVANSDLALLRPGGLPLTRWFALASHAPQVGEKLWTLGYRWDTRKEFAWPVLLSAVVTRVAGAHVFLTDTPGPGSSGSCWVNTKGEAVAVNVWGMACGLGGPCAVGVGVWSPWLPKER